MKNFQSLFLVILSIGLSIQTLAQQGTLRGTVYEDLNGEPLFYAAAALKGTSSGAVSDFDGKFEIKAEPGIYILEVSFVGLATVKIEGLEIKAGEVTVLDNIRLKDASNELEMITVTAETMKNTESALLSLKKKSVNVMDGISAQKFRKVGDSDAATAVNRVPGVSIQGGKYVYVRGLGDRYTKTMLNGMDVPGLDPDRNAIQMDIFPTNILENITVVKSFTADLPADFTGGVVNIETKDFPDKKTFSISASAGFNPSMHFNNSFRTYEGGSLDFLGFDDGTRTNPLDPNTGIPNPVLGDPSTAELTERFNPTLAAAQGTSLMNLSFGISGGNQYKVNEKYTLGLNASLSYKNNTEFYSEFINNSYVKADELDVNPLRKNILSTGPAGVNNAFLSGMLGLALKSKTAKYRLNIMHLQNGEKKAAYFLDSNIVENANVIYRDVLEYSQRSITNVLLSGNHLLNEDATWVFDWKISPTLAVILDKDIRSTPYVFDGQDYAIDASEADWPPRLWRNLNEIDVPARVDLMREHKTWNFPAKLKFGTGFTYKRRNYEILNYQLQDIGVSNYTGNADELLADGNIWDVQSGTGSYYATVGSNTSREPGNTYESTQTNASVYVSEEFQFATRLKAIAGVRLENYNQYYTGTDPTGPEGLPVDYENENFISSTKLFPSANLIFSATEDQNIRFSYSRTIARPSFKEISAVNILDFYTGRRFIGNPELDETDINNLDLRWEYFMKKGQTFSVSAFYKDFTNPIEVVAYNEAAPNDFQPQNVGDARVVGLEFEVRKNLDFINPKLESVSINANVSLIDSRVSYAEQELVSRKNNARVGEEILDYRQMQGQSPYLVNVGLAYTEPKSGIETGLFYNVQGKKLFLVGITQNPDVYELPFHSLNLNLLKSFGEKKQYQVGLGIDNILGDDRERVFESYQADSQLYSKWSPGTTFKLRFRYNLQ